jgi:putative transcriptional regulator
LGDGGAVANSLSGEEIRDLCNIRVDFMHAGLAETGGEAHLGRERERRTLSEKPEAQMDLTGKILIAMPGMGDPRFMNSVVLLCAYSSDGAMGLIVNKQLAQMGLKDLMEQLSIKMAADDGDAGLYFGGPVETGRGFVLHTPDYNSEISTLKVNDAFSMTATLDVLEDIASGDGPEAALVALGYSGWGPGQLEGEIAANGWLIGDPSQQLIFGAADGEIWSDAMKDLGIDPMLLSDTAGHA